MFCKNPDHWSNIIIFGTCTCVPVSFKSPFVSPQNDNIELCESCETNPKADGEIFCAECLALEAKTLSLQEI